MVFVDCYCICWILTDFKLFHCFLKKSIELWIVLSGFLLFPLECHCISLKFIGNPRNSYKFLWISSLDPGPGPGLGFLWFPGLKRTEAEDDSVPCTAIRERPGRLILEHDGPSPSPGSSSCWHRVPIYSYIIAILAMDSVKKLTDLELLVSRCRSR